MDIDALLGAVAEQPPCGPDLEYDGEFQTLELAARGKDEQVLGDRRIPAMPPAWPEVRDLAQRLFARTKDLRVAIWWTRASLAVSGLTGLRDGLALIHRLLTTYWDEVHPRIDPAEKDPSYRMNVLAGLIDPATTLREVRHALITEVAPRGRIAVFDVLVAAGKLQPGAGEPSRTSAEIQGLLEESATQPAALEAAGQALGHIDDLQKLLAEKVGTQQMVDLGPLRDLLTPVAELCRTVIEAPAKWAETSPAQPAPGAMPAQAGASPGIRSRADAIRMLDEVCEYLTRSEPASPAPLLIRRAQRLMNKSFMEIIEDLNPDSLSVIKNLGGIKD